MPPPTTSYEDYGEEEEEAEVLRTQRRQSPMKKHKGQMDRFVFPTPPDVLKGRKENKINISRVYDKELRDRACSAITRWLYDAWLPINATNYDSFKEALELVGQFGTCFKPPILYELRVPLLRKEVTEPEKKLVEHKSEWASKGCLIISDRWQNFVVQKDIVNFLVNSPKRSFYIKLIDVSTIVKDANILYYHMDHMVDEVGEANVVQVVTDNASNYVKASEF